MYIKIIELQSHDFNSYNNLGEIKIFMHLSSIWVYLPLTLSWHGPNRSP